MKALTQVAAYDHKWRLRVRRKSAYLTGILKKVSDPLILLRRISGIKSAHKAEIILVTVKKISHNIRITGGD